MFKKVSKSSLLYFIAAALFAETAISKMVAGDSTTLMTTLSWVTAILFAVIGFRELVKK